MKQDEIVTGHIYYLHSGDNKPRYIGATTYRLVERLHGHRSDARCGDPGEKNEWMRIVGVYNVNAVLIKTYENIRYGDFLQREIETIIEYTQNGFDLKNESAGGAGKRISPTQETRDRISKSSKGRTLTPEQITNMSQRMMGSEAPNKGVAMSESQRKKISITKSGETRGPRSQETKDKISAKTKGRSNKGVCKRWHEDRGIVHPTCEHWCAEQRAKQSNLQLHQS